MPTASGNSKEEEIRVQSPNHGVRQRGLPMNCTTASVQSDGVNISTKTACVNDGDVPVAAQSLSSSPLAPYPIEDPVPSPVGCTISSIYRPQWIYSSFEVESDQHNASSVSFHIILTTGDAGFQFPISITQAAAPLRETPRGIVALSVPPESPDRPSGRLLAVSNTSLRRSDSL